ncbi:MAG: hypothetical protein R2733_01845 [Acidimicrobiales bacterium]
MNTATEGSPRVVLVRVSPRAISLLMVGSVGLFMTGAYYLIDMGNDPGFVLTQTTGIRWAFAGSGLMAASVWSGERISR